MGDEIDLPHEAMQCQWFELLQQNHVAEDVCHMAPKGGGIVEWSGGQAHLEGVERGLR
jgi:hypothetical protein